MLRAGEREGQVRDPLRELRIGDGKRERRRQGGPPSAALRERELQHEELVEREPAPRREQPLDIVGEMDLPQR